MIISNISNIKPCHYNDIFDILDIELDYSRIFQSRPFEKKFEWKPIRENFQTKEIIEFLSLHFEFDSEKFKQAPTVLKKNDQIHIRGQTDLIFNDSILFEIKKQDTTKWEKFKVQAIVYLMLYSQQLKKNMTLVLTDLNKLYFYFYSEFDVKRQRFILKQ